MRKKIIFIIAILLLIAILIKTTNIYNIILKTFYPTKYSEYVSKYSNEYNIDSLLIFSIMKAESNFDSKAISKSGAKGLMQLMDSTANEISNKIDNQKLNDKTLLDPEKSIMVGTKYYSDLLKKYDGNVNLSLAAYNAGIGNVDNWIKNGVIKSDGSDIENVPYKETNMYIRTILKNYKIYKKLYAN